MKPKTILLVFSGFVGVIAFSFLMGNIDLVFSKYFGVRKQNIKREIFEESKSHVHGTIKNLSRLRLEYKTSKDEAHKAALREMILSESASFDMSKLPYNLQNFIRGL